MELPKLIFTFFITIEILGSLSDILLLVNVRSAATVSVVFPLSTTLYVVI